jgi:hypothetical protein
MFSFMISVAPPKPCRVSDVIARPLQARQFRQPTFVAPPHHGGLRPRAGWAWGPGA